MEQPPRFDPCDETQADLASLRMMVGVLFASSPEAQKRIRTLADGIEDITALFG
jgi:hypothetical protein